MKEEKKTLVNVTINVEAVASAARNSDSLEETALEVETINPMKLTLEQNIYALKTVPINDKVKGKRKEFAPKTVGIKTIFVTGLASSLKEGCITINGSLDVPKAGHRVVKLEECLFDSEDNARAVARVIAEVELERATAIFDEAEETVNFIKKQIEDDRF